MAYPRPPITEAVIELRFAHPLEQGVVENVARRLRTSYAHQDIEEVTEFKLDTQTKKSEVLTNWFGIRLSSADKADILILRQDTFVCSRLAPYVGWEAFRGRASDAWAVWRKTAGAVEISRIGVRYINRIDVPNPDNVLIRVEDYLNLWPRTPDSLVEPMSAFTMQVVRPLGTDDCGVTLTSSTLASPLIGFASFALDIDIYREKEIPRREDALWALLDQMRVHKNRVFENSVTDRSRELFNK